MSAFLSFQNNTVKGVDLVIFDKDGTLIDVHTYWANIIRMRAELVCKVRNLDPALIPGIMDAMGVDSKKQRIKPEGPVGIKKREIVLKAGVDFLEAKGISGTEDIFDQASNEVDHLSQNKLDELISPLKGMHEIIDQLTSAQVKIALATTDLSSRARLCLSHLNIEHNFACVVGADKITKPKPDPEIIQYICRQTGIPSNKAVMIGDAPADVECGLRAACKASIGLTCGMTPAPVLQKLTPYVIKGIHEISIQSSEG